MKKYSDVLDFFSSIEMKCRIEDLVYVIDALSEKTPVRGFHYSFYLPGWIGYFQRCLVKNEMRRFSTQNFYKNLDYLEFGHWIVDVSKEIARLQQETQAKNSEIAQLQTAAIIRIFEVLTALWINYCPEISTYNKDSSPAASVFNGLSANLRCIGYEEKKTIEDYAPFPQNISVSFSYRVLGYLLNTLLIAVFLGIICTIFH